MGIDSAGIPVSDVTRAVDWFARVLGFESGLAREDDHEATVVVSHPSGACVALYPAAARAVAMAGFPALSLNVASRSDLDLFAAHLTRSGVLHAEVHQSGGGAVVRLWGPDMIQVRIYWRS